MTSSNTSKTNFRIPCEFQIRYRVIDKAELEVFKSYAMRPSPYSTLKADIESQLSAMPVRDESKSLLEKAFQILLNIDQRLERLEEKLSPQDDGAVKIVENYEWVHGELGGAGFSFLSEQKKQISNGSLILIDMILPSFPEQRIVAAAQVSSSDASGNVVAEFVGIHEQDTEFVFRFVAAREREILRTRAMGRDRTKES